MEACVRLAGLYKYKVDETMKQGGWAYFHGHAPDECALYLGYITCHHMDPTQQRARYDRIKSYRKQLSEGKTITPAPKPVGRLRSLLNRVLLRG